MNLIDAETIVEYIVNNYKNARKIVEVGIGKFPEIAIGLKSKLPEAEIVVTDINPHVLEPISKYHCIKTAVDDIIMPDIRTYENSDLIYSIRPPPEFQHYLLKLAKIVKADLLLRLLTNEPLCINHPNHKIVNYKNTVLHVFEIKHANYIS